MVCFIFGVFYFFFKDLPSDCSQLFERGERISSIYAIRPHGSEPFVVFCDMSKGRTPESASASFIAAAYKPGRLPNNPFNLH